MRLHPTCRTTLALLALVSLTLTTGAGRADEPKGGPAVLKRLKFRSIGPAAGGRICRAAGVPGDPRTYYAAASAGGVWKSVDGGIHWGPIFDDQPCSSVGSLAIALSDPNVIYVGTGEANIRGNVEVGNGIYKSTDAGKTWKHVWKQEGQIGTLIVHPTNPDVAYAAVLGHAFGPNEERGVYRTTDGGKSWKRILYRDRDTGASDVAFDPSNPHVLFAGLWQTRRRPWELTSGGPGSGLYTSRDGGDTWTQLIPRPGSDSESESEGDDQEAPAGKKYCPGLPKGIWGKIGVAVAPSDGRRIYALIEAEEGGLFRSDDGGKRWKRVSSSHALRQRAWYFTALTIHPTDPDVLWCPEAPLLKSIDGGKTFQRVKGLHHDDHHDLWVDPKDPLRMIDSNDGGVDVSTNGGESWHTPPLPLGQFYHISVDNHIPYEVAGTMQDIGTASGPSNSLAEHGIPLSAWHPVGGGETGFTAPDPTDPDVVYAGEYGGYISRYDHHTRQARSIGVYPFNPSGHAAEEVKYRFQWTAPILISLHDHRVVYHAANVLFRTSDAGQHWTPISPDLTRNDKSKQKWSGGPITGDNTGTEVYGTIFAIAESPRQKGLLWAASDDGLVHVTRDGGRHWDDVTANIKGLPEWGTVRCIEASPFDADTAYLVVDAHKLDDRRPYLFATTDGGHTWKSLADTLPQAGYLNVVREDPRRRGLLYVGTEQGVFFSHDNGGRWQQLKLNLPTVSVTDLVVKGNDLVVGTNGRSVWIFDDLTPVRELAAHAGQDVYLYPVQPAVRYRYHETLAEKPLPGSGQNPPPGAILHFYLKERPKKDITLEVLDAQGRQVTQLSSKPEPKEKDEGEYEKEQYEKTVLPRTEGLHRVIWDLRWKGAQRIRGAKVDSGEPQEGPLANPGVYTLRLTAGGKTVTGKLEVLPDVRTLPAAVLTRVGEWLGAGQSPDLAEVLRRAGPLTFTTDLEEQLKLALSIRDDISRLSRTVEQLRSVRGQVVARNALLREEPRARELVKAAKELLLRLDELENKLHNPKAEVSYDILAQKGGAKLYSQLAWLFELIRASDGAPTQGLREVYADQRRLLDQYEAEWKALQTGELARLNDLARKLELPGIMVPAVVPKPEEEKR
jgi:photosystem II stability/assembly factor-like uncharacterized protein